MDQSVSPPPDEQADDTEFATVASAATVEAAKKKALEQLRKVVPYVREDDVEFIVVDEGGQGGFLGMGRSQPRVEARVLPGAAAAVGDVVDADEALDKLDEFVTQVTSGMGLEVDVEVSRVGEAVVAEIAGGDLGLLIGRHGQTLDALQYLAAIVVNGHSHARRQVIVDAEGYRNRREVSLQVGGRAGRAEGRTHAQRGRPQADDRRRAQDRASSPQGPPQGRDPLRGRRAAAHGHRLSAPARLRRGQAGRRRRRYSAATHDRRAARRRTPSARRPVRKGRDQCEKSTSWRSSPRLLATVLVAAGCGLVVDRAAAPRRRAA